MKSLFEELGGTYRQVGYYFIPDIELSERKYKIGKVWPYAPSVVDASFTKYNLSHFNWFESILTVKEKRLASGGCS